MPRIESKKPDRGILVKLIKKHSLRQIAAQFKVSAKTVWKWCKQENIKVVRKTGSNKLLVMKNRIFKYTNPSSRFYFSDGRSVSNIYELSVVIPDVDESTFRAHVESGDFRNWIKGTLNNNQAAQILSNVSSKEEFVVKLNSYIVQEIRKILFSK